MFSTLRKTSPVRRVESTILQPCYSMVPASPAGLPCPMLCRYKHKGGDSMPMKPLYGVYVFLTPETARSLKPDLYGGERALTVDEALQSFMRRFHVFYVETAL